MNRFRIRTSSDDFTEMIVSELDEYIKSKYQTSAQSDPESSAENEQERTLDLTRKQAAIKFGISPKYASRINGDTPEEIMKDAEAFSKLIQETSIPHQDAPLGSSDPLPPGDVGTAMENKMRQSFGVALEDAFNTPGGLWKKLDI